MLRFKQGQAFRLPVVLTDASTGAAYNGVAYTQVQVTVIKADGTMVDLVIGPADWVPVTQTAYSQKGYYNLIVPAAVVDQDGILQVGVAVQGADFFPGVVDVYAVSEKEVYDRIGAPVLASISHDIQTISAGVSGDGGFGPADRDNLLAVKLKTENLPEDPASSATVLAKIEASFWTNDRLNLQAIKTKTDNLPTTPASQGDVTSARDSVNTAVTNARDYVYTNLNYRLNEIKSGNTSGTGYASENLHAMKLEIDAVKLKTDNLPTDPASQAAIVGIGFDSTRDTLHQLSLALDSVATGGGSGFGSQDRADLLAVKGKTDNLPVDPASQAQALTDINAARDSVKGTDTTNSPYTTKRTISECFVQLYNNIKPKTDNLPSDPASNTTVNARAGEIKGGAAFAATDSLHDIKGSITASNYTQADRDAQTAIQASVTTLGTKVDGVKTTADSVKGDSVAIRGKTDNLPADPVSTAHLDTVVGAGANAFTAEDHDLLLNIKAKTDSLPATPASAADGFQPTDRDILSAVRYKTDALPPDPASNTAITNLSNKVGVPATTVSGDLAEVADLVVATS